MKNKKSQLRRLMAIYIVFLVVLTVGFVHGFSIDFVKGFAMGKRVGIEMQNRWNSGDRTYQYLIGAIPTRADYGDLELSSCCDHVGSIQARPRLIDIRVEKTSTSSSRIGAAFRIVGDNPTLYIGLVIFMLSRLAVVILMAVIIHSLRNSIRDEVPLKSGNIWCTRIIGALLIFSEMLSSLLNWIQRCHAAHLLEGSNVVVDNAFTISYWNIVMGILVIFTAEAFAIGQQLGEEQKFTI